MPPRCMLLLLPSTPGRYALKILYDPHEQLHTNENPESVAVKFLPLALAAGRTENRIFRLTSKFTQTYVPNHVNWSGVLGCRNENFACELIGVDPGYGDSDPCL